MPTLSHIRAITLDLDDTLWPVPVTLDVSEAFAEQIAPGTRVALRDGEGVMLAVASPVAAASPVVDRQAASGGSRVCVVNTTGSAVSAQWAAFVSDAASPSASAWTAVARVLLNLDEFITRE